MLALLGTARCSAAALAMETHRENTDKIRFEYADIIGVGDCYFRRCCGADTRCRFRVISVNARFFPLLGLPVGSGFQGPAGR